MQADALTIEARAQTRLADEYDAAQERGEVQKHGGQGIPDENIRLPPVGLSITHISGHTEFKTDLDIC